MNTDARTFEQVRQQEQRLTDMRRQVAELEREEQQLGEQIAKVLAEGDDATRARARRVEVRELRADLAEAAGVLEQRLSEDREVAGRAAADKRVSGIARAFGSLLQELTEDDARLQEAAVAYKDAANRLNQRFRALVVLRAEGAALVDRFGVAALQLPPVVIPAKRQACAIAALEVAGVHFLDHGHIASAIEHDEDGVRTRRSYQEIASTPGGEIIRAVGAQPWPELTPKQREIVADKQQQRREALTALARFDAEADRRLERRGL